MPDPFEGLDLEVMDIQAQKVNMSFASVMNSFYE